ncbi:glycosyltransferase family 2 protein [Psychromonas sp. 14N.309.X.WAT.B.A12]|uniref:glycosyltransferase family 2 protein n=1 Tax=Psychromonas sp. 14N.309.X.WAT.B.A12 TaxID=2998322 RepID=UPI0025B24262|nr:glycosyltransferase family 2 protein [Psychromonas sp. 14N.309.X.WAT.B.A12]MDN2664382.1 glycosyltransferase family 2 protein [Psychromonas sp. 14N.309.X.WAT.B.A12]
MLKLFFTKLRNQAKKSKVLTSVYRRYFMTFPVDADYTEVAKVQGKLLSKLKVRSNLVSFSILVPVYKPDLELFKGMVSSVLTQTYSHWQLILVDDASEDQALSVYLSGLAALDTRVTVVRSKDNVHISAASNLGLAVANGNYIVLLDHDDLLHKEALKTVAHYIEKNPDATILYSDEDKLTAKGERAAPHFKPQWNRDLLYSMNYISHLGVYKKSTVDTIGGFKLGVEGSQDYDLLLRCVEQCSDAQIIHIPYVLYHWRAIRGSTALAESEKGYSLEAGLAALQEHLVDCKVELGKLPNTYKVNWPVPESAPLVSIIIPTKNAKQLVKQCIDSIYKKTSYSHFEILLVDNQSDESDAIDYFKQLEAAGKVRVITYDAPFNYSAINNYAVTQAKGDFLVFMNNDIEILSESWLTDMVANVSRPDIGCVGAKLYYPNGRIQHAGVITGLGGVAGHSHKHFYKEDSGYFKRLQVTQNLSAVTAACLAVRKAVFEQVGGLNEQDLTIAFNDVDFCLKVQKAGYRNLWSPHIEMVHHESISRGAEDTPEKKARFASEVHYMQKTWGKQLLNDPCYSEWLTLDREDFSLR